MNQSKYQTDVALLSVTTTEFRAVTHFHEWRAKTFTGDDQIYDVSDFERDGQQRRAGYGILCGGLRGQSRK